MRQEIIYTKHQSLIFIHISLSLYRNREKCEEVVPSIDKSDCLWAVTKRRDNCHSVSAHFSGQFYSQSCSAFSQKTIILVVRWK